jgi:diguanylate cyclase (GGDEF)-like protein
LRCSDLLGRIGGEEFAALLIDVSEAAGLQVADRLRKSVQTLASYTEDGRRIELTVSIGLAKRQYKEETLAQLMKRADTAMYQAKAAGRNRIATNPSV